MQQDLLRLQRQVRRLTIYALATTGMALIALLGAFTGKGEKDIIRARGIVIEDSAGRDRILIGAPAPWSGQRVRTDLARARAAWAVKSGMDPDAFMKNYEKAVLHDADGIVFMNEQGFDKFVIGSKVPDPNSGHRIVDASGLMFNDDQGWERGGMGVTRTQEGKYRMALGMDAPEVGEALHLFVLEDGTKAMRIVGEESTLFFGRAPAGNPIIGNKDPFSGIRIVDKNDKLMYEMNVLAKKPSPKK